MTDADEVMLTTTGGILIRTPVADMRLIGRNTQGVRLIRVEEGDSVSSLAKLPEEELGANVELEVDVDTADAAEAAPAPADGHPPHLLDDGVAEAEASDHLDEERRRTRWRARGVSGDMDERREKRKRWVQRGRYAVEVDVSRSEDDIRPMIPRNRANARPAHDRRRLTRPEIAHRDDSRTTDDVDYLRALYPGIKMSRRRSLDEMKCVVIGLCRERDPQ